jgi:hypothetical protein
MPADHHVPPSRAELERAVERQIVQRTWGRVWQLRVQAAEDRLVVRGHATSHHVRQLALLAVGEVVGLAALNRADVDIQVPAAPTPGPGG